MSLKFNLEKISERCVAVTNLELGSNAGGIELSNFAISIDPTQEPRNAKAFREKMEKYFELPVKILFVTHYHSDHTFALSPFKDTTIIGSLPLNQMIIEKKNEAWTPESLHTWKKEYPERYHFVDDVEIIVPTIGFQNQLEVRDEDLVVHFVHVGGHTACSSYAYFPKDGVLFSGDLIFSQAFPYAGDVTCNPDEWIKALEQILNLDFEILVPGHGPIADKREVEKHLRFFIDMKNAALNAIKDEGTPEEIVIPDFYTGYTCDLLEGDIPWVKAAIKEHWFNFYRRTQ